ncbi:MAG: hypothetical protein FJX74_02255 [Armatimonadetes bacterium]|nr:hypothetical protein [Armatimonadota bacterium]
MVWRRALFAVALCLSAPRGGAQTPAVTLERTDAGWRLLRSGEEYLIRGAGGADYLDTLAAAGGNSIRTWDAKGIDNLLDQAHELGLSVTVGLWLGQPRQGFDYRDASAVGEQLDRVRAYVERYRAHPAVLMWGLGNEIEGDGDDAAVWLALNRAAALVHELDPDHPTMTVIAEIGGEKVRNLHRLCPEIDIVGINSYAGMASLAERYGQAGGVKPYVITEFGPPGHWEVGATDWGAPLEPSSTEKEAWYRRGYEAAVVGSSGMCLGSYAFLWGHKQEVTPTWYGMFLPDGARLGAVDAMSELWSGQAPANACPRINELLVDASSGLQPGQPVTATLDAEDPDGDALTVSWTLLAESGHLGVGGDPQQATAAFDEAVVDAEGPEARVKMPKSGGGYRLFAFVRDGHGAAVANVPLHVDGPPPTFAPPRAALPLLLYADGLETPPYIPSGWMGRTDAIALDDRCATQPHTGATCLKVEYKAGEGWGGVAWQSPEGDWGDRPGGLDLTGARRLMLWARGERGGETVEFKLGILGPEKAFPDSASASSGAVRLTQDWQQLAIPLDGKDLSCLKTAFVWVIAGQGAPVTLYLDDIRYE